MPKYPLGGWPGCVYWRYLQCWCVALFCIIHESTCCKEIACCWIFLELQFEECPKWLAVKDILSEIEAEIENNHQASEANYSSAGRVMIAAQDDRMCSQIQDVRLKFFLN